MAVTFKALWGPSNRAEGSWGMSWIFIAVRPDGTGQRYSLRFDAPTRKFQCARTTRARESKRLAAYVEGLPLEDQVGPMSGRTIAEILKSKLPESDIVACTRLGLLHRRAP